ncbi:uncharacterized protein LOC129565120 [Sitodiplosis mosellana]|uniref:uncharacterized protein LOC129565120 n=1 Tax=Sitodiplosis mosellana TaxID=263140 RepID=UPI0024452732|nr:uncharacterized protein LOC129565120 [Sitodiplosis mosellana]
MNPSILIIFALAVAAFATADYRPEPYRINFGAQNYTRLIDEFTVVSPAKPIQPIRFTLDYPGGNAYKNTYIRRIEYIDYNNKDARTEFRIVKGGCEHNFAVIQIISQIGKGINSKILFYGPTP